MEKEKEIVNRVASSSLVSIDLEEFYTVGDRVVFDMKECLFQGMILKEKDFRDFIKANDWSRYQDKFVAITCSVDAIIPTWAYMLLSVALQPFARKVFFGTLSELEAHLFHDALSGFYWEQYRDAKVVIKGCSKVDVPASAYVEATNYLRPLAASIMYGEACSTVPLFKRPKS
jgi:hypothetical protein